MRNNKFVLGNLPGELELTQDEIKWLKLNLPIIYCSNQLIDYSGETYSVEEVTSAKIVSTSSQWDPAKRYREVPEQAFKRLIFRKIKQATSTDVRFSFSKNNHFGSSMEGCSSSGLFPIRTDYGCKGDCRHQNRLKKSWGKLEVSRICLYY